MKDLDFKLTGFKELDRLFDKLPDQVSKRLVDKALLKSGKPIVQGAKSNVNVFTGNLKKSIGALKGKTKKFKVGNRTVLIGGRVGGRHKGYHAHLLEFGTKKSRRRPFLGPATRKFSNKQRKIMIRELAIGIHSEVNKLALKFRTRKR